MPSWVWQEDSPGRVGMAVFYCLAEVTLGLREGKEGGQESRGKGSQNIKWMGVGEGRVLTVLCEMERGASLPILMELNKQLRISS